MMELKPDAGELLAGYQNYSTWPFRGEIGVRELLPPAEAEPERSGTDVADCHICARPDQDYVWTDEHWRLNPLGEGPFPGSLMLFPRQHVSELFDLPAAALTSFGPLLAQIERSLMSIGRPGSPTEGLPPTGRLHISRWGDRGYHLHIWLMPRPFGALQLRGPFMPLWMDVLQDADPADVRAVMSQVAADLGRP